ncbi:MAG TPA: 50S ribosomal protein L18 [Patescibacteria group bacterium]|nr:50S ribosomal protein L18 [Patescibacteria group bacterium]
MNNKKRFLRRQTKVRGKILDSKNRNRLSVYRSNLHIYAQVIDDTIGKTLVHSSDKEVVKETDKLTKKEAAFKVGVDIAKKALKKKIKTVVFDRSGYRYHGRVQMVADGAREGGLIF